MACPARVLALQAPVGLPVDLTGAAAVIGFFFAAAHLRDATEKPYRSVAVTHECKTPGSVQMKLFYCAVVTLVGALLPSVGVAAAPPPAATAAQPGLVVGAVVYDPQGGEVGKIDSISGDNVVLDTGTNKATLPKTSFGKGEKGPAISATKAQIDAAVAASMAQANAARDAALIVGTEVRGKAGEVVGIIKEVSGDRVVLSRPSGLVSLNKALFTAATGSLILSLTADELNAAASQASTSSPADSAAPSAEPTPTPDAGTPDTGEEAPEAEGE